MTPGQPVSQPASASQTSFPDPRHMRGGVWDLFEKGPHGFDVLLRYSEETRITSHTCGLNIFLFHFKTFSKS